MNSDKIKQGPGGAPVRSLFYGMGYVKEEIDRPLIGVVNAQNELIPGHMLLDRVAQAVKRGILLAGGTPLEFPAIGICDGIAMGHEGMKYPLASRELICDSIEAMARGHALDGLVLIPNCDKIVPGMMMAAARLNIPAVMVSGGPMRTGNLDGDILDFNSIMESVGSFKNGDIDEEQLEDVAERCCPGCGSCSGLFTANSMNSLTEVLGMGLPYNGTALCDSGERIRLAKRAGLLHDIGKSIDHEMEGSHIQIGVELCKKYKESATVINAVESHHGDVEPTSLIACIVQAADTISAARPGARRETLETYTNRLKQLEDIANSFKGVDKSFAIQAGREIRVMVVPDQVDDAEMVLLARDISKQIEAELEYPGQIKVNVIRESRVTDYAK